MIIAIISVLMTFGSWFNPAEKQVSTERRVIPPDTITTTEEIISHKNTSAYLKGRFQKFTPWTEGKGANHMFWDWEIELPDSSDYPVIVRDSLIDLSGFENKEVIIYGYVFYGIIIGDSNPNHQSATGYRIDAKEIYLLTPPDPISKITFNLNDFNEDGLREHPVGEFSSANYEFCIPADENTANEVKNIDPTIGIYKTSKGRSGCSDSEWLCIGGTRQADFKKVILKLAELSYVRKISETFWE